MYILFYALKIEAYTRFLLLKQELSSYSLISKQRLKFETEYSFSHPFKGKTNI